MGLAGGEPGAVGENWLLPAVTSRVHVWRAGGEDERRQVLFRDWLRHDADGRTRYEAVKRELASHEWNSSGDYAEAKRDVVAEILRRAERWERLG